MGSVSPTTRSNLVSAYPGGYWKQDIVDHVLLVNPYFPPTALFDEIRWLLPDLVGCYPSPYEQTVEQVGNLIGQKANHIVVCSGIAEIIPILLQRLDLRVVVAAPSFNPYERTAGPRRATRFDLSPPNFVLETRAFADVVRRSTANAAIIVSPNNPTSQAVPKTDLLWLANHLAELGRFLFVDESFVEFSPEGRAASLESEIERFPNLVVLKSLGKVYGTCGLRMGYLLTSNAEFASKVRSCLPLWNVSTIAEFVLSRLGDYQSEAESSWDRVRADRDQLFNLLNQVPGLFPLVPHANFVYCKIPADWPDGPDLAGGLLQRHGILLRHDGGRSIPDGCRYLRIAARSHAENARFVAALQDTAAAMARAARTPQTQAGTR